TVGLRGRPRALTGRAPTAPAHTSPGAPRSADDHEVGVKKVRWHHAVVAQPPQVPLLLRAAVDVEGPGAPRAFDLAELAQRPVDLGPGRLAGDQAQRPAQHRATV